MKPAATQSLPLASTTRGRHSQTDNKHDPSPSSSRPGRSRRRRPSGRRRPARRACARHRRRAQRVESDVGDCPQPACGTPSSARRPDRLAVYMVYCSDRRKERVSRGTRQPLTIRPQPPRMTLLGIITACAAAHAEVPDRAGPRPAPHALRSGRTGVSSSSPCGRHPAQPRRTGVSDPDRSGGIRRSLA
jgi:hypothetical protein